MSGPSWDAALEIPQYINNNAATVVAIATLIGPVLAALYAVLAYIFLASFGEVSWFMTRRTATDLLKRFALLGATIAILVKLQQPKDESTTSSSSSGIPPPLLSSLLCVNAMYLLYDTRTSYIVGTKPDTTNISLRDKVILVTGANTGIGKETVRQLALLGATVVLACRSRERAEQAIQEIVLKSDIPRERLLFLQCDLSDLDSVRNAVKTFETELKLPLDVLINNAGVMFSTKTTSKDHFEMCLAANHLGHYLLTRLLLPKLLATNDGGRVLNLASITYKLATRGFDFDDYNCESKPYTLFGQYAQSKVCNMLFTKELARRYKDSSKLKVYAINPGLVRTDVTRNMNLFLRAGNLVASPILHLLQRTPAQGAYTSVHAAMSKNVPESGSFLANGTEVHAVNEYVQNSTAENGDAHRLWNLSAKLVNMDAD